MDNTTQMLEDPFETVQSGNLSQLKVLLLNGTNIHIQDKDGSTLLHHAINANRPEIVKFLLEKGVDATRVNKKGETVLHIAASKNQINIAKLILESVNHEESKVFINAKTTATGVTALHIASKNGFLATLMLLLSCGATYNVKNKKGKRPVDLAKDHRATSDLLKQLKIHFEQARGGEEKLYEHLEKCNVEEFTAFASARDCDGYNLQQIAIVNGHSNLATLLQCLKVALFRRYGHRPNFETNYFDELLLLATSTSKKLQEENCTLEMVSKCAREFVSTFRSLDKRILDPNVIAIEDMLSLLEDRESVSSFLEHAKQVIEVHLKLFSASIYSIKLLESTRRKDWISSEKFMAEMAYVNLSDEGGWTPLLHAVNAGNKTIAKMLLDHGARVNCSTKIGKNTTLHVAANNGYFEIVELLLERDSNGEFVDAKTGAKGSTALHIAAKSGRLDIVMWLLKCRATYCLTNKDGQVPMDLTSDEPVKILFKMIGDMFDDVKNGNAQVIDKLERLSDDEFLALVLCQNEQGYLLKDVAMMNDSEEIAGKITDRLKVLLSEKGFKFNDDSKD